MLYVKHMIRTQVYLPKDLYQDIRLLAKKEKKPAAQVIRQAIKRGLDKRPKQETLGNALLGLTKIAAKGPRDLSTKHDKYLYEE